MIHGKLCYTVHYESLSWWNAEEACRVQGGKLFKADEEGKVAATFKNGVGLRIWTGAKERDGDRGFYWIDGNSHTVIDKYLASHCLPIQGV